MPRKVVLGSLAKISLITLVVGLAVFAGSINSGTSAFFRSVAIAFSNPIGDGGWQPPAAPLFWLEEDTTQVKLDWFSVPAATGYKIYRSTDNVSYSLIASLGNVTTYTDSTVATDGNYYYKVTGVDAFANETVLSTVGGKYAGPREIVIDDNAMTGGDDFNNNGVVTASNDWSKYAVKSTGSDGVNAVPDILQNAVGGDNHSTQNPATGQTFSWQTNASLDGTYEVLAQYICDSSRGNAKYKIFSGATQVGSTITKAQNVLANGSACGSQSASNTESQWVSLGNFSIVGQGKVELTAEAGQAYILADAVAFRRVGDATNAPIVTIDREAAQIENGYACGIGSAKPDDKLKVTVTNWQPNYKLQLRYKIAGGGYNAFFDASTLGITPTVVGNTASFEYLNTGNSPEGPAGWQAQVVDNTTNLQIPNSNVDELTYIIISDSQAEVCNGHMSQGFESAETLANTGDGNPQYGFCGITTADQSQANNTASVQILKWHAFTAATQYRITPYRLDGASWVPYGAPYTLNLGDVTIAGGVVTYNSYATAEVTTSYFIEALDTNGVVLGQTTPQNPPFTCTFTVNRTKPPMSRITVTNAVTRDIQNRIANGSFESGLSSWNVSGDVALINGADAFTSPQQGSKMVKIGRDTNEGQPARLNVLSQQIPAGVRSVGFYYNMFTYDRQGFDDPGFMVFANDKMVFQRWASEIDKDNPAVGGNNLDSSGWQYFGIDVSQFPAGTNLTLAFYAGNDNINLPGATPHQSWVYLDNFSTNEAVVNHSSQFEIVTNPGDQAHYLIGTDPTIHNGNTFTLSDQPASETIYYWASNSSGTEPINSFHVLYDNAAPETITDLNGEHAPSDTTNLFHLTWTSPHDDNRFTSGTPANRPTSPAGYEIKYSTTPIAADVAWNDPALKPVTIITADGLPYGGYRSARPEGEQESYDVRTQDVGATGTDFYFVVRSYDAAGNTSANSTIAHVTTSPVTVNNDSDIVINEVLPDPTGDDAAAKPAGEWVELYNKSSADKDVNNWALYDETGTQELVITSSNSDNDLNPATGETVVPAHGYLTVYRDGSSGFELNNTGAHTVRLFNKTIATGGSLVDALDYNNATENKSFAHIPDGTGPVIDPVPTPGRVNAEHTSDLVPQARIWWQEAYNAKISIFDAINYTSAHYVIEYKYNNGDGEQQGGIEGNEAITSQAVNKGNLYFATCSSNGECVPHTNVVPSSVKLTVTLTGSGIPDRTIVQPLTGSWPQ